MAQSGSEADRPVAGVRRRSSDQVAKRPCGRTSGRSGRLHEPPDCGGHPAHWDLSTFELLDKRKNPVTGERDKSTSLLLIRPDDHTSSSKGHRINPVPRHRQPRRVRLATRVERGPIDPCHLACRSIVDFQAKPYAFMAGSNGLHDTSLDSTTSRPPPALSSPVRRSGSPPAGPAARGSVPILLGATELGAGAYGVTPTGITYAIPRDSVKGHRRPLEPSPNR